MTAAGQYHIRDSASLATSWWFIRILTY
jgi:hypothetical protein